VVTRTAVLRCLPECRRLARGALAPTIEEGHTRVRSDDQDERGAHGASAGTRPKPISLFSSLVFFVPSYMLAVGGALALNVVAARVLGTSDFGYFAIVMTATTLIGQFALFGVHRSGLREAARTQDTKTLQDLRRGVRAVLLIPLPVAAVGTAITVLLIRGGDPGGVATALLTGALVFAAGYQKVCANFLRGIGHVRAATLLTGRSGGAAIVIGQSICVLLVGWLAPGWGLPGVLAAALVGYLLPLSWGWWLLHKSWPAAKQSGGMWQELRKVIRRDWRFAASQAGGFLNSTVELWVAGALLSAGDTSLYAAAQRTAHVLTISSGSLTVVFSPALARLAKRDDHAQMEPLVRTASTVSTIVSCLLWIPMMVAPTLVLSVIFGTGFEGAAPALMFLATAMLLNSISGMSATTLSMAHHEGDVVWINWTAAILRVVVGVICASTWGITALAASSCAIASLHYFASWSAVRWRLSISTHATFRPKLSLLRRISG